MNKLATYFFSSLRQFGEARVFRKLLALYVIYKCIYWVCDYRLLFTPASIVYKNNVPISVWQWPAFLLFKSGPIFLPVSFLVIVGIAAIIILLSDKKLRIWTFLLWIGIININNAVYPTLSAGDYVLQNLLFFAVFLSDGKEKRNPFISDLDIALHNTGVIALQIQVCIIYFYAAYSKLLDADWMNGSAVNFTLSVREYSSEFLFGTRSRIGVFLNYLVIAYQLLFPVLVWVRKIKKWYLLLGVIQHLFIAFIMGLPSFGLIMIIAYSIFYVPFSKSQKVL